MWGMRGRENRGRFFGDTSCPASCFLPPSHATQQSPLATILLLICPSLPLRLSSLFHLSLPFLSLLGTHPVQIIRLGSRGVTYFCSMLGWVEGGARRWVLRKGERQKDFAMTDWISDFSAIRHKHLQSGRMFFLLHFENFEEEGEEEILIRPKWELCLL